MPLADWLIAKPSLAAQAQLQHSLLAVRANGRREIDATLDLVGRLLQQNMHYHTLLTQAIAHIAELELAALFSPQQTSPCSPESVPSVPECSGSSSLGSGGPSPC